MDTRKNKNGFSFISVFAMVSIVFMTIPFAAYLIQTIDYRSSYDQLSVNQFFLFLRDEAVESVGVSVESLSLTFELRGESASIIEQHDDMVVRKADNGFEVFLRQVQDIRFAAVEYGVNVFITMLNGDQFEKTIIYYN
ncbi:hypothetical protein GCM10028778_09650 [Barrientosiimonas marina]